MNRKFFKNLKLHLASDGFTLTELLIVIALIGIVGTIAVSNVIARFNTAKVDSAKIQIKQLAGNLNQFNMICGFYPTTDQGLDALVKAPGGRECKNYPPEGILSEKKVPKDPWSNDFLYESDGTKFKITSLGSDGQPGGENYAKDLNSDDL